MASEKNLPVVLIVEDEALIAMELDDIAAAEGWASMTVADHAAGRAVLEHSVVDFVLLDGTAHGIDEFAFARILAARGTRFAFCTAAPVETFPDDFREAAIIVKPYREAEIVAALNAAREGRHQPGRSVERDLGMSPESCSAN